MTPDNLLNACALAELVARQDGDTRALDDAVALLGGEMCSHAAIALYWCGAFVNLAKDADFDIAEFIAAERAAALAVEQPDPGGMA